MMNRSIFVGAIVSILSLVGCTTLPATQPNTSPEPSVATFETPETEPLPVIEEPQNEFTLVKRDGWLFAHPRVWRVVKDNAGEYIVRDDIGSISAGVHSEALVEVSEADWAEAAVMTLVSNPDLELHRLSPRIVDGRRTTTALFSNEEGLLMIQHAVASSDTGYVVMCGWNPEANSGAQCIELIESFNVTKK